MDAQTVLQWKIEATQLLDDITYGIRSIETCGGSRYCTGVHAGQLHRAAESAALFTDSTTQLVLDSDTLGKLRAAKKIAAETLKETKLAAKDYGYGTARQLKLALTADSHEYALGA